MEFVETPIFTKIIQPLLTDEDYQKLQQELANKPEAGKLIRGSGGLRKYRWAVTGTGKRGGLRIIYFWHVARNIILMLYAYPKAKKENLTFEQMKKLKSLMEL
ncbi:MAG: type II toxin-antitoxin system RelE/ParE family toxin [SAR324 cluster bacterium]|jgi:mRNA-degrading endonuclease RelE of RelBE toxin-antitoxin system|nr:type II toxin-antitoxin system RelE/ParE family toxin [SAR324 cluster bacterium]MCH2266430.1 type II toxin-antitoxin system RelE/ParE family toxin [SAR324 cluster bacterium]